MKILIICFCGLFMGVVVNLMLAAIKMAARSEFWDDILMERYLPIAMGVLGYFLAKIFLVYEILAVSLAFENRTGDFLCDFLAFGFGVGFAIYHEKILFIIKKN